MTCFALFSLLLTTLATPALAALPATPQDLFVTDKIWSIHLTFSPSEWAAMEPQDTPGPGAPFEGPSRMLASRLLHQGDESGDARLSRDELNALGRTWWTTSGVPRNGRVDLDGACTATQALLPGPGGPRGNRMEPDGPPGPARTKFEYVEAALELDGQRLGRVAVRYKGNNTFMESHAALKRPLKIDLGRGAAGHALADVAKLDLRNGVNDAAFLNETLSYRLFRDAGVSAPRTSYARVSLTVPGQHERRVLGLYTLVETVDRDFLRHHFGSAAGALFKPETRRLFEDLGSEWAAYDREYAPKTHADAEAARQVMALSRLVSHASDAEFSEHIGDYLDLEQFARFMAVTVWLSSMDSILGMGHNFYVYLRPDTQRFQFIPWDLDHSFGLFPMGPHEPANLSITRPWQGPSLFLERVYRVEAFRQLYFARLKALNDTLTRPERLARQVDDLAARLRPVVKEESSERLARFEAAVARSRDAAPQALADPPRSLALRVAGPSRLTPGPFGRPLPPPDAGSTQAGRPQPPDAPWDLPGPAERAGTPLKAFLRDRHRSVARQLSVPASDPTSAAPVDAPHPPGAHGSGPGAALASALMAAFDADQSGAVTEDELLQGLGRRFATWDRDCSGTLTLDELAAGLARDLVRLPPPPPGIPSGRGAAW